MRSGKLTGRAEHDDVGLLRCGRPEVVHDAEQEINPHADLEIILQIAGDIAHQWRRIPLDHDRPGFVDHDLAIARYRLRRAPVASVRGFQELPKCVRCFGHGLSRTFHGRPQGPSLQDDSYRPIGRANTKSASLHESPPGSGRPCAGQSNTGGAALHPYKDTSPGSGRSYADQSTWADTSVHHARSLGQSMAISLLRVADSIIASAEMTARTPSSTVTTG